MGKKASQKSFQPPRDPKKPTIEEFVLMVAAHDPTYQWSKDEAERERGERERRMIDETRKILGDQIAVPVWNRAMHKKIVPSLLSDFLWKVRRDSRIA
jgi:hypothetical protein